MEPVKEIWTNDDFDIMGWHDSRIHCISFPGTDLFQISFDIDYIFEWVLDPETKYYSFWIAPCTLVFDDAYDIEFNIVLGYGNGVELEIQDIHRKENPRDPFNGKRVFDYTIETQQGEITLSATGYNQVIRKQPIHIQGQVLPPALR